MQLEDLRVFVTVAVERSFSKAAGKLHRTQPAISQAVRRIEEDLGERLFDRSSRNGTLTEAGALLKDRGERLLRMAEETAAAVRELHHVRLGRVIIGCNEAAVHSVLPIVERFAPLHPRVTIDVRRVPSRQVGAELLARSLDFGVLTFQPTEKGLQCVAIGGDELVMLASPSHRLASRRRVSVEEVGRETVIAHNDPSPARDRVLRLYERRHAPINIQIALPSLDGIKRAVEMGVGVAVLPRRCALTEISSGQLVAVTVPELGGARTVRLVFRRGEMTRAAQAFLETLHADL